MIKSAGRSAGIFIMSNIHPYRILLFFLFAIGLNACSSKIEEIDVKLLEEEINIERGTDIEINYTENGALKAAIAAKTMIRHFTEEPYAEFPEGIEVKIYNLSYGKLDSRIKANYAMIYENQERVIAREDVVVVNKKGEVLKTEELYWIQSEKKLYSNSFVRLSTGDEVIYGKGFEANEDLSDWVIKDVTGILNIKEDDENTEDI